MPPANHAVVPVRDTRPKSFRMRLLLCRGTNGKTAYTPEKLKMQERSLIEMKLPAELRVPFRVGLIELWMAALVCAAVVIAALLTFAGWGLVNPLAVLGLAAVAALAERNRVRLSEHIEVSICLLPALLAGVLFGPLAAMLVWGVSMFGGFSKEGPSPYLRLGIYSSSRSIAGAATGLVAYEIAHGPISDDFVAAMAAAGVGAVVAQTLDVLFASCTLRLRRERRSLGRSPDPRPVGVGCSAAVYAYRRGACTRVHADLTLDVGRVLRAGACCSAAVCHVPAPKTTGRGFGIRQHPAWVSQRSA